jgi:hypothetical protein
MPFLVLQLAAARPAGPRAAAERVAAATLAASAGYILFNESFANWQSLWLCAALAGLSFILARARDALG